MRAINFLASEGFIDASICYYKETVICRGSYHRSITKEFFNYTDRQLHNSFNNNEHSHHAISINDHTIIIAENFIREYLCYHLPED